jgi:hypothetical protein
MSNALALETLQLGEVMPELDAERLATWLGTDHSHEIRFPDTAGAVAEWLMKGDLTINQDWVESLWRGTRNVNRMM